MSKKQNHSNALQLEYSSRARNLQAQTLMPG